MNEKAADPSVPEFAGAPAANLRRRLGLFDLVLAQVLLVVGTNWFGVAAKLGGSALQLWIVAIALFHLPLAFVVIRLTRACPIEGGGFEWAGRAFGPTIGLLYGWSFWLFVLVFTAAGSLGAATGLAYALLPGGAAALDQPLPLALGAVSVLALIAFLALRGFGSARWFQNAAALGFFALMLLLAARVLGAIFSGTAEVLAPAVPPWSLATLAHASKLAVYGLAGLEAMSILSGEVRDPKHSLPRSVAFAAPLIGLVYLIGTAAVLVSVDRDAIDLVNPAAQVLTAGGGALASIVLILLLARDLGQSGQAFAAAARLPMVAGWNGLLPAGFGNLDPRGVPRRAVLVSAGAAVALALLAVASAGRQEAFQLLLSAAGVLFGLCYVTLFLIPLAASRRLGLIPTVPLRAAAASGLVSTLLFLGFSVYPIVEVADPGRFAFQVLATVAVLELPGVILLFRRRLAGRRA